MPLASVLGLVLANNCAPLVSGQAGFTGGTSGALGANLEASGGLSIGPQEVHVGPEFTLRAKLTQPLQSVAFGAGARFGGVPFDRVPLYLFAQGGMHLLQIDLLGPTPYVSLGSPYFGLGVGYVIDRSDSSLLGLAQGRVTALTVGLSAEYNVRFLVPGEGFFSLNVGALYRGLQ